MIEKIEQLMLKHFCTIPFHNLNLLYGKPTTPPLPGGTCSDKTLAFLSEALEVGADAHLHTAYIGGKEIHRLVRVNIDGRVFFADVGNGWPTLRLLPVNKKITFRCFGMNYHTEISDEWVRLYHEKRGKESLQMEINTKPRPERKILNQIRSRYSSGIEYPFSQSLRFSLIVDGEFLFLRGNRLERYSKSGFAMQELGVKAIPEAIKREFGFDVRGYFN